ncbi:DNA-dependent ATPase fun30 [Exophiala xenobiotica]|nr:DNA-dependent ATPase fun30 [Exophiala xenobiotica]KAK5393304.1 DNA-dependent ATPase fun30 [Exophiala xenobiotica]KAK5408067.1 DNA-dependent ATPase fun30 [Exophiala xenobiotica]KAK5456523.1 DNA-dependent ATPase fun30 [Exophiala xenobiotica]KAK5472424.1 DNA-dependent ATPase fun30 [Exophiala xenobiotica]
MSSHSSLSESDDELFNPDYKLPHETVETLPLRRANMNDDDPDMETMSTLPRHLPSQKLNQSRQTQPTQLINRSPDLASSPVKGGVVQVTASSPLAASNRKPTGYLASAMAPAGTAFRKPQLASQPRPPPITIDSDDEGPVYRGGSSDSEGAARANDIKTSTFVRKTNPAEKIPESPQGQQNGGLSRFMEITAKSMFRASPSSNSSASSGVKRSADVNANAYGNASKRPRQTGPARALSVTSPMKQQPDMELDDISDYGLRQKVRRMMSMVSALSVRECYEVLVSKKGHYDDAVDVLLQMSEKRHEKNKKNAIDLTGSEDELMPTPAARKVATKPAPAPKIKAPAKSIAEKWSSTQNVRKPSKTIDVFDTPPPQKKRTLVRGRKRSSSPAQEPEAVTEKAKAKAQTIVSDESDEADSAMQSEKEADTTFDSRLLNLFNTCTAADLTDTASISRELAQHLVSERPFKSLNEIRKIQDPKLKPAKGRRKVTPAGEKIVDKVETMLESYEAVDYLVKKCQNLAKPLAEEMKSWGVNVYGSQGGELDMVSLQDTQRSSHDSGIGTPVSDEESEIVKKRTAKNFIPQPSIMSEDIQMKDYQVVGINWLHMLYQKGLSCILADDMGLGKTCQVIAFLALLLQRGRPGPHLIVVPAATLENWLKEFKRFCPTLKVEPYYSTNPSERVELREILEDSRDEVNVIVTTYTLAKGKEDFPWLKTFGFDCTVYDEGHMLKNAESQAASKLVRIQSNFRLLLTGTPLQNNLKELISLLGFLMPSLFKEKAGELTSIFSHNVKAMDANHEALLSEQRIKRARSMLTPFILRRKKNQVLKDLPKKERRVELCEMTPQQSEIYQSWLDTAYSIRERKEKGENVTNESANILMKLRQAAIHPLLFRRVYPDKILPAIAKQCLKVDLWRESNPTLIVTELQAYSDMEIHTLCAQHPQLDRFVLNNHEWLSSGKVQKTIELLRRFIAEGHRTLIFSQFVMVLDILELVFEREAIDYFRLDGNTKVSERQDLIDEFSADDNETPVFMLSTKAGGAGINLAKANKVIVFDSGFNPQDDIQAENRAHRIGQVKEVEVVRLVSKGTVEEQIYAMGLTKLKLDEQVAGDGSEEQPPRKEGEESEKEVEGRMMVEEMFFKKLDQEPIQQMKAEVASPVKKKEQSMEVTVPKAADNTPVAPTAESDVKQET